MPNHHTDRHMSWIILVFAALMFWAATPAFANTNSETYWEDQLTSLGHADVDCTKTEHGGRYAEWEAPHSYILVVVKGGSANNGGGDRLWWDVSGGDILTPPVNPNTGEPFAISHIIRCRTAPNYTTPTTTIPNETTTTVPDQGEPTTTIQGEPTTTVTVPDTTVVTTPEPTETTAPPPVVIVDELPPPAEDTTTTVPVEPTSTIRVEVSEVCEETEQNVEAGLCELPFTGPVDLIPWVAAGLASVATGGLVVRKSRRY